VTRAHLRRLRRDLFPGVVHAEPPGPRRPSALAARVARRHVEILPVGTRLNGPARDADAGGMETTSAVGVHVSKRFRNGAKRLHFFQ
jgi:hypothetical protein